MCEWRVRKGKGCKFMGVLIALVVLAIFCEVSLFREKVGGKIGHHLGSISSMVAYFLLCRKH
jgi:hypothetical protein